MKNIEKKKLIYICIGVAVIALAIILACIFGGKSSSENSGAANTSTNATENSETKADDAQTAETSETSEAEEKVYTPTFMYFVSKSDADYDKAMTAVKELQGEYGDKVKFDIVDVDEKPEAKENFQMVDGNTPFLIMLNTNNDISAFEFKCADKEKLAADIENALK